MPYNIPKYILKRMFPKNKSMYLVKKDGASEPNYIMFKYLNLIMPIEVMNYPELAQFNVNHIDEILQIKCDDKPVEMTIERLKNDLLFWFNGTSYDFNYFLDLLDGKVDGFLFPMGATSIFLLRIRDDIRHMCEIGKHHFSVIVDVTADISIDVTVPLDLIEENVGIEFDPNQ